MPTVLIIDDDVNLLRMLQIMLERGGFQTTLASHGEEGIRKAQEIHPDVVIVDVMMPDVSGHDVCRRLREDPRTNDIPLLVLTARAQPVDRQAAITSGASDYLSKPVSPKVLIEKVHSLLDQPPAPPKEGRVIACLSLRGGAGQTTLAVNIAAQLTLAKRGAVCVADFSPSSGHVALQLRLQPKLSWGTYRPDPASSNQETLKRHLMTHDSGLQILASPMTPLQGAGLNTSMASALLQEMRLAFGWIVVDSALALDDSTLATLSVADTVVVVMNADVAGVQTATGILRSINGLGPHADKALIVLNQVTPQRALPQTAIEKALGRTITAVIPFDENQLGALSQGQPLAFSQPTGSFSKAVGDLTNVILEQAKAPRTLA